jgi:hypothetical protein
MVETVTHLLLTASADSTEAQTRVRHFFNRNFLVKYDRVTINESRITPAADPDFWPRLEAGLAENRRVLAQFLADLQESGFRQLADLGAMPQGYESKILHIVTHLLDGFFGIDSRFYNMQEDAHTVSDRLRRSIREKPQGFWLVAAECAYDTGHEANQLAQIRKFDVSPPES